MLRIFTPIEPPDPNELNDLEVAAALFCCLLTGIALSWAVFNLTLF